MSDNERTTASQVASNRLAEPRLVGLAGLAMVAGIVVLGPVMAGPDSWAHGAVADYRRALGGSAFLSAAPTRFGFYALLTAAEIMFLAGLWLWTLRSSGRSLSSVVVGLAAGGFVAGGIASDGFSFAQLIALHGGRGVAPDANLGVILDVASNLAIIETNVCLGLVIGVVSLLGLRQRSLPGWLCRYGLVAAATAAVPGFLPTRVAVFVLSNLLRLSFLALLSVSMYRLRAVDVAGSEPVVAI